VKPGKFLIIIPTLLVFFFVHTPPAHCQRKTPMDKKCEQESEKESVSCLQWRALMILAYSRGDKVEIGNAIKLLNQARTKAPKNVSLLSNLSGCYLRMKDYKTTLKYMDKILTIQPNNMAAKFFKCMLLERLDYPIKKYRACYRSVAYWYQNRGQTKDVNYVYALLMLGSPDAERIKNEYLASLKRGSELAKMWNELLKDFDRDKHLRHFFP
jgi:tetratricopeptide (TPR) repeat protein